MEASSPFRFVLRELSINPVALASAVFWRCAFALLPMQVPFLTGAFVNALHGDPVSLYGWRGSAGPRRELLLLIVSILLVVGAATGVSAYCRTTSAARVGRSFVKRLRGALVRKWLAASLPFHQRLGAGELLNRTMIDPPSIRGFVEGVFIDTITLTVRISYPILMLFFIDPTLALIPLVALPAQWVLSASVQSRLHESAIDVKSGRAALTTTVKESLDAMETVQTLCAESHVESRITSLAEQLEADELRSRRYAGIAAAGVWTLTASCFAISLWVGGLRVLDGRLTTGDLVAFTGFVSFIYLPFRRLSRMTETYRHGLVSIGRIREILEADAAIREAPDARPLRVSDGSVRFENVTVTYSSEPVLRAASFEIDGGALVAVTGRSGAGKSSLLHLMARLQDPTSGRVLIDGQDISRCTLASVRAQVAMVPQRPVIFSGSVLDNVQVGRPEASLVEIERACRAAGILDVIERLPARWQTRLGDGGDRLSGGEAQRVAIARALLRNPRILLLDEPTSALDSEAEAGLMDALHALTGMTIVVVAHRPHVVRRAERVLVVGDERVTERYLHAVEMQGGASAP